MNYILNQCKLNEITKTIRNKNDLEADVLATLLSLVNIQHYELVVDCDNDTFINRFRYYESTPEINTIELNNAIDNLEAKDLITFNPSSIDDTSRTKLKVSNVIDTVKDQ